MDSERLLSEERTRGEGFRLLAVCFYPPQLDLWREENLLGNLTRLLNDLCPAAAECARRMQESVARCSAEELMVEYSRLFVGPQRVIAAPYGSVYLEEGRRVMGDSTLDALRAYEEAGLSLDHDFRELPDHIAVELEFVAYLSARSAGAAAAGNAEESSRFGSARTLFLNQHLRRWVPAFCTAIVEGTRSDFYRDLARCLAILIGDRRPS